MRPVVEDEADAGLPALLQGDVGETLFHRAVVPLGHVRVAVGVFGRRPRLYPVHASTALQPAEMHLNFAHSNNSQLCKLKKIPSTFANIITSSLVMGVAGRPLVELEEFPQVGEREMPLDILLPIDDARAQGFFVGLPLENLLLDRSDLD